MVALTLVEIERTETNTVFDLAAQAPKGPGGKLFSLYLPTLSTGLRLWIANRKRALRVSASDFQKQPG
jgi:hypothetical protein